MKSPLRFSQFVLAYGVLAATLIVLPSATVEGGPFRVAIRSAPAASSVPSTDPEFVPPTTQAVVESVPRRSSATPLVANGESESPVRISIPRLGVEGNVIPVGIAPDRQLDVPSSDTAGWYRHSSLPLDEGASVIAAHVDYGGKPGLFFDLRLTILGDEIQLLSPDGSATRYVVTDVVLYDKTDLPSSELFRSRGAHALHLVTCGGVFDPVARSYRGNQVVTAVPT